MFRKIVVLISLAALVHCEDAPKAEDDRKQDKRGATSYTQVVHGSTGLDPIEGRSTHGVHGGGYYGGHGAVQVAYLPVTNYHGYNGYGDVKTITLTKEIPVPVQHAYPIALEKRIPYPVNYAVAVPVERPVPIHVIKQYPVAIERPVHYAIERPIHYPVPVPVKVPYHQPVAYAVSKPYPKVPAPVYVKSGNGYASNEGDYSSDEDSGYNKGYSGNRGGYSSGSNGYKTGYNEDH